MVNSDSVQSTKDSAKMDKIVANKAFFEHSIGRIDSDLKSDKAYSKLECEEVLKCLINYANKHEETCMRIAAEGKLEEEERKCLMRENDEIHRLCVDLKAILRAKIEAYDNENANEAPNQQNVAQPAVIEAQNVQQAQIEQKNPIFDPEVIFFDGNSVEWFNFEQNITKALEKCADASEIEKFDALLAVCDGKPKDLIGFFKGEFSKAFDALKKVYGLAHKQTSQALMKLIAIPRAEDSTYDEISKLLEATLICEDIFVNTNSLDKFECALAAIVIEKLPPETKRAWGREHIALAKSWAAEEGNRDKANHIPNWSTVKTFMQSESVMLATEMSLTQPRGKPQASKMTYSSVVSNQSGPTNTVSSAASGNSLPRTTSSTDPNPADARSALLRQEKLAQPVWLRCTLCPGIHPRFGCPVYNGWDLYKKDGHVWEQSLCTRCLRPNHPGECIDPKCNRPCPKCNNGTKHNSTLCPRQQRT